MDSLEAAKMRTKLAEQRDTIERMQRELKTTGAEGSDNVAFLQRKCAQLETTLESLRREYSADKCAPFSPGESF